MFSMRCCYCSSVISSAHHYSLPNPLMYPGHPGTTAAMMAGPMAGHGFISPMYTAEQMMWMQQNYAQYMAQYMQ